MTSKTANLNVSKNDKSSQMKQDIGKLKTLLSSGNVFLLRLKLDLQLCRCSGTLSLQF